MAWVLSCSTDATLHGCRGGQRGSADFLGCAVCFCLPDSACVREGGGGCRGHRDRPAEPLGEWEPRAGCAGLSPSRAPGCGRAETQAPSRPPHPPRAASAATELSTWNYPPGRHTSLYTHMTCEAMECKEVCISGWGLGRRSQGASEGTDRQTAAVAGRGLGGRLPGPQ